MFSEYQELISSLYMMHSTIPGSNLSLQSTSRGLLLWQAVMHRVSGKTGVCIATAGPGATNLVTGLANAYMDGLPVLALTGETPTYSFGKGALQESSGEGSCINQNDIFRGITRYNSPCPEDGLSADCTQKDNRHTPVEKHPDLYC